MILADECTCFHCTHEPCAYCHGCGLEWGVAPTLQSIASIALLECMACGGKGWV